MPTLEDMSDPDPTTDPRSVSAARLGALRERASAAGHGTLVLTPGEDLAYLTGSALESHERLTALVVPLRSGAAPVLVLPALELTSASRAAAGSVGARIHTWSDGEDPIPAVASLCEPGAPVAVSAACPALHLLPLQRLLPVPVELAAPVVDAVRAIKSTAEVWQLADAASRIDAVHARMCEFLRVGRTEREVADDITRAIVEEGLTHAEFVIVGSGPNGADPHHDVSDRVITSGDVVVVDIGGPVPSGYHSDCTRTYSMGEPDPRVAEEYAVLQEAQRLARAAVRPGVEIGAVDEAAREHLRSAGLADRFVHRTGHGIGLGLHEPPFVVAGADTVLEEGMTFSVEPGIYLSGEWGARLEDIVAVTADGCLSLNDSPRGLTVLGGADRS